MVYHDLTGPHEPRQTKPKHILRAIRQRCTARLCYEHAKATHSARAEPKAGGRAASRPCEGSQPSVRGAGLLAGRAVKGVS